MTGHSPQPPTSHTLAARHVTLAYERREIVHDLDLDITPGTVGAIIGANGCGKSTLLKALARLLTPTHGAVTLDGKAINTMPTRKVATIVGLLPQSPMAPEGITIADLVSRGRHPYQGMLGSWSDEDDRAVAHALEVTGLADLADRPVDEVSGGQRQRAWIALALAQQTDILLLDEPTTYLDIAYQLEVLDLLSELNATEHTTIVMVLHDLNQAARYTDWILAVKDGRQAYFGTPDEVISERMVAEVFDTDARIIADPDTGLPLMLPGTRHSLARLRGDSHGEHAQTATNHDDNLL
ncbi:ABC transporter ATP-binding protein [Bifidobacterium callitrichos]|uniref:ABC transporter, ATP binding protein, probably Coelichelin uptake porter (Iron Chelate Uptake) n=1 Tax=Bifidobacterium callitrichos DSM 23973 TaxID=1437609 RepID=A0A087A9F0_9BIFI|nr:ABC transporter ATP-binding protein [Bifidobacterium callitrichos]KFI55400.1 ABC transporter, ATP binding protein, probably Coelichelin uptake porter (Iron Chelate Uptake) [Bifidobacterium callitrichos DSM 23973]